MTKPKNQKAIELLRKWHKEDLFKMGLRAGEKRLAREINREMILSGEVDAISQDHLKRWLTARLRRGKK